ncbi:hypothetical protein BGX34_007651, partial [Mortierella sp. NVP85]
MEAMNSDAFGCLLRDGAKVTDSSVCASMLQADIRCYNPVPAPSPLMQGTPMPIAIEIPTQASHETRSLGHDGSHFSDSMLSPVNSPSLLHPSPQYPALAMLTTEPQPEAQQLRSHIQQLQFQLVLKDQQIQYLLAYLQQQQHVKQLVIPEFGHPLQQQLLSRQFVP